MSARLLEDGTGTYFMSAKTFTLAGAMNFADPTSVVTGSLRWNYVATDLRGAETLADVSLDVRGSRFTKQASNASVLGSPVPLLGYDMSHDGAFTQIAVATPGKPTAFAGQSGAQSFKLTVNPGTGLALGSYVDTATGERHILRGVVLQSEMCVLGVTDSIVDPACAWTVAPTK